MVVRGNKEAGENFRWSRGSAEKAFDPDQPRDEAGRFASGGGGGAATAERPRLSARAQRALATHKPSTAAKQRRAEASEAAVSRMVGGRGTGDNNPVDVVVGGHGVEVKTLVDNSNDKVTMHPDSRDRKERWARREGKRLHTVVVDARPRGGGQVYYRAGVGSFRLASMTPVRDAAHLRRLMRG